VMPSLRKPATFFFIVTALLLTLAGFAQATTAYFTVQSGKETTQPITLAVEDRVLIQFKVVGGTTTTNTLRFSMTFPNATVKDFGESGDFLYRFTCDAEGSYVLTFNNTGGSENMQVTLNYEVDHYIFGIPQMLFMVILIAAISLVGVAVFIGLSRKP
jgi:hypothetical protein